MRIYDISLFSDGSRIDPSLGGANPYINNGKKTEMCMVQKGYANYIPNKDFFFFSKLNIVPCKNYTEVTCRGQGKGQCHPNVYIMP